jgi:hypothetical protein
MNSDLKIEVDLNLNFPKNAYTYLGQKGFTILKKDLTLFQQNKIKTDLTVKPYVPGSPCNNNQVSFPAYRESINKLYVPHYYGKEILGRPTEYKIPEGENIHLPFKGELRDYQIPVVQSFFNHVEREKFGGGLFEFEG